MKELPITVLKWCPCVDVSLFSLHISSGSCGRAGSEVSTGHIFLWGVLEGTMLMGGKARDGSARASVMYELGFLLCSVTVIDLSCVGLGPRGWSRNPEVWVSAGSTPFNCVNSPWQWQPPC